MSRFGSLFRNKECHSRSLDDPQFVVSVIEQMAVALFVLDRDGKVIVWNEACEQLTGLAASDVVGSKNHWKGFYTVARPCLADLALTGGAANVGAIYATHDNQASSQGRMKAENWCDLPCGTRCYLAIEAVPLRDARGKVIAVIETLQNMTVLKELEEERCRAEEARKEAIRQERLIVVDSIGVGLTKLAAKDLTYRMSSDIPEAYRKLQSDFNAAIGQLEEAMQRVTDCTDLVRSGTAEIATAADDLSRRTEQQAASLEETAAALEEITVTVKKSAEGANHARQIVATAAADSKQSAVVVRQAIEANDTIAKSAGQISQIIGVIDEIAFQTNLLALNAGVEAARAGDAGRGFAVVATEVRALAQRSAEAAKEIKALISASTTQVEHGVKLVAATGESLERMMAQVTEINDVVNGIAEGAKEQAMGLGEVNTAINQMDQMTQQNAAMVEESTAATRSLSQEISQLSGLIGEFQVSHAGGNDSVRRELQKTVPHAFRQRRAESPSKARV
ncbi:MAG: methyl-accepting chemotaxis protein [Beijerinckiaceae bacterium]